jgi:hypothetical protein
MIWRLPSEASPSPIGLRPCPARVVLGGGSHQGPVALQPVSLPLDPRKTLVGQVGLVKVFGYERLPDGTLVGGGRAEAESAYHALGIHHQRHLESVNPLGLGGAPTEGCLSVEEPLARSPHSDHGRNQGCVQDAVDRRRLGDLPGEGPLQSAHLRLQGSYPAVELTLGAQVREVGMQVRVGESPEVSLAAKAGPRARTARVMTSGSESRAGRPGFLLRTEEGWCSRPAPVVYEYVQ